MADSTRPSMSWNNYTSTTHHHCRICQNHRPDRVYDTRAETPSSSPCMRRVDVVEALPRPCSRPSVQTPLFFCLFGGGGPTRNRGYRRGSSIIIGSCNREDRCRQMAGDGGEPQRIGQNGGARRPNSGCSLQILISLLEPLTATAVWGAWSDYRAPTQFPIQYSGGCLPVVCSIIVRYCLYFTRGAVRVQAPASA